MTDKKMTDEELWGFVSAGMITPAHTAQPIDRKCATCKHWQGEQSADETPDRITLEEAFNAGKQSAPSVPDGWKLVPIEPTQEMTNHVIDERLEALVAGKEHTFIDIYKAMLAAAPKPEVK